MTRVRTTHLELRSAAAFKPSGSIPVKVVLTKVEKPDAERSRFLYASVGRDYYWNDRLPWTVDQWMQWLSRPEVETWVLCQDGEPVGYFELELQDGASVEIVYFGLLPSFTGKGLGGYLLARAVERAFAMSSAVSRVWLHTCTLDHPAALAGYLARGFLIFAEEDEEMNLPESVSMPMPR